LYLTISNNYFSQKLYLESLLVFVLQEKVQ